MKHIGKQTSLSIYIGGRQVICQSGGLLVVLQYMSSEETKRKTTQTNKVLYGFEWVNEVCSKHA